jgi:hypothetical protein
MFPMFLPPIKNSQMLLRSRTQMQQGPKPTPKLSRNPIRPQPLLPHPRNLQFPQSVILSVSTISPDPVGKRLLLLPPPKLETSRTALPAKGSDPFKGTRRHSGVNTRQHRLHPLRFCHALPPNGVGSHRSRVTSHCPTPLKATLTKIPEGRYVL